MIIKLEIAVTIVDEDIADTLDTAGFSIGYWAAEAKHDADNGTYQVRAEGNSEPEPKITYAEIGEALATIAEGLVTNDYLRDMARQYFGAIICGEDGAAGYIDGDLADAAVQVAVFGELVYG